MSAEVPSQYRGDTSEGTGTGKLATDILEARTKSIVDYPARHGGLIPDDKRSLAKKIGKLGSTLDEAR